MSRFLVAASAAALLAAAPLLAGAAHAETARYTVVFGGKNVGRLVADTKGAVTTIDYDVKNNGRGPTDAETITSNADGLPVDWRIKGATTFGSKVEEHFTQKGGRAEWQDSTGKGQAKVSAPGLYVAQSGSPWGHRIIARALLKAPG